MSGVVMGTQVIKGQVALITGGASGIGAATVEEFLRCGAKVVVADRDDDGFARLKQRLSEQHNSGDIDELLCFIKTDLAKAEQVEAMIDFTISRHGRLDILFNNAGIAGSGLTVDADLRHWDKVMDVNLKAVFIACKTAIPHMLKQGGGAIINTASISGLAGDAGFSSYSASKAAVINLTRSMALEQAKNGIRINSLCPGAVDTPLLSKLPPKITEKALNAIPMGRMAQPMEMAKVVRFLASDDASFMTGAVLAVDGGITAWTGQPSFFE